MNIRKFREEEFSIQIDREELTVIHNVLGSYLDRATETEEPDVYDIYKDIGSVLDGEDD